jgi:predicted nuclease of restriction endonuclease-like (RecB) superfamily
VSVWESPGAACSVVQQRAAFREALIERRSSDLSARFNKGFSRQNLQQMRTFFQLWPATPIPQTPPADSGLGGNRQTTSSELLDLTAIGQRFLLSWSTYERLMAIHNPQAWAFYETEVLRNGWSVRKLDRQMGSQYYERIALSRDKVAPLAAGGMAVPADDISAQDMMRDRFVQGSLGLEDRYSESDLEAALVQHLADFLLELGDDFAFVGRQRKFRLDVRWFSVDLLLFQVRLRCLLVMDLEVGRFSHADAGQMHMYLNYARQHWMKPGEDPPVGLILCASKGADEARYALEGLPNTILAAEYRTVLPNEAVLVQEIERTRRELDARRLARGEDAGSGE